MFSGMLERLIDVGSTPPLINVLSLAGICSLTCSRLEDGNNVNTGNYYDTGNDYCLPDELLRPEAAC
jgi:hypothetical protein